MDSEDAVGEKHWFFDVILDKITARLPVLKNHKGLEVRINRRKMRLKSM